MWRTGPLGFRSSHAIGSVAFCGYRGLSVSQAKWTWDEQRCLSSADILEITVLLRYRYRPAGYSDQLASNDQVSETQNFIN